MKRKVILRADGSQTIGMGHFIRTLALAEMLKDDFYLVFATREPTEYQLKEISRICDESISLPKDNSHFDVFLTYLQGNEIVVLDNYYFDTNYQRKIREKGCKLVCIDDMHDKHYVADVVINHAEGIKESDFSIDENTKLCLGLDYALLRSPFFIKDDSNIKSKDFQILIGIGGADPEDISFTLSSGLSKMPQLKIAIMLGNAYKGKLLCNINLNVSIFKNLGASEVYNLMRASEIGIFPSSTIAIEAISARLPFITSYFIDNQKKINEGIITKELGVGIESFNLEPETITNKINTFLFDSNFQKNIIKQQCSILDKKSPQRIRQVFKELNY